MTYDVSYRHLSREKADENAIKDIKEYLTPEAWDILMQGVGNPNTTIDHVNMSFGLAGVQGYPFHAFCRKYLLKKYREWMHSGDDAVMTDEQGYSLEKPEPRPNVHAIVK